MYKVTINFQDGTKKVKEHIVIYNNACILEHNAWDDYDNVKSTAVEEEK